MSCSLCIKCEKMVGGYEKYCPECVSKYGVRQDVNYFRYHSFSDWDAERKAEFEKDVRLALSCVSANIETEVIEAGFSTPKKTSARRRHKIRSNK